MSNSSISIMDIMLFDNNRIIKIRNKYEHESDLFIPEIIKLDRFEILSGEREYLENLFRSVSSDIKRKWIGDFATDNNKQHIGAWFEIMLYGWLQQIGKVIPEPKVNDALPDFSLNDGKQEIFIEARAITIPDKERERVARHQELFSFLQQVDRKYIIKIEEYTIRTRIKADNITKKVIDWLDNKPENNFEYRDDLGNEFILSATFHPKLKHAIVFGGSEAIWVNPEPLKEPIKKKAKQHRNIREAGHPYIIALFLEPWIYCAEDVITAWFGNTKVIVDINTKEIVKTTIDKSGLHYFDNNIFHKKVSGSLVFKTEFNKVEKRRELFGWYIQNPYADVPIDYNDFPVQDWFQEQSASDSEISMGWSSNPHPS